MSVPATPTNSKVNEEIKNIIDTLNTQCRLQLPARGQVWSPSKVNKDSTDDYVHELIRFLFFKDRNALHECIFSFKQNATTRRSGWLHKPHGAPDVIPFRTRGQDSRRAEKLEQEVERDEKDAAGLKSDLLDELKTVYDCVRRGESYSKGKAGSNEHVQARPPSRGNIQGLPMPPAFTPGTPSKSETPKRKQSMLEDFFATAPTFDTSLNRHAAYSDRSTASKANNYQKTHMYPDAPSSDDFFSGSDDFKDWGDIPMPDAQLPTEQSTSTEEEYQTPPSEPADEVDTGDNVGEPIPYPSPALQGTAKKRPHPESASLKPLTPRKASREKHEPLITRSHNINSLPSISKSTVIVKDTPNASGVDFATYQQQLASRAKHSKPADAHHRYPSLAAGNKVRASSRRDLSRSFGSTSSFATVSTTTTTPATSFLSDSATTSFESSLEHRDETVKIPLASRFLHKNADDAYSRASSEPPQSTQEDFGSSIDYESVFRESNMMDLDLDLDSHPLARLSSGSQNHVTHSTTTKNGENKAMSLGESVPKIHSVDSKRYMSECLFSNSPTAKWDLDTPPTLPLRQRYELERFARSTSTPFTYCIGCAERPVGEYGVLWSSLRALATKLNIALPEPSSPDAWVKAEGDFQNVSLSGDLKYTHRPGFPLFEFTLRPLKLDASYRLARKYGGDRIFTMFIPGLEKNDLPYHLRPCWREARDKIISWIVDSEHHFLGRTWRAFSLKPEAYKKNTRGTSEKTNQPKYRILLFAVSGDDFRRRLVQGEPDPRCPSHYPLSIEDMVNWFMPFAQNRDEKILKLFSRLTQAVSSTSPTIVFQPCEIIRSDDARADAPKTRRLDIERSHEKQILGETLTSTANVMNDGCARISKAAANDIAEKLGLAQTPSAFQARIAGAKGMWIVDALDESLSKAERDYWIEITDSQLKFQGHPEDNLRPDKLRMTFEVLGYSKRLKPSTLNFQFIPILEDGGVPGAVFERLLQEDLTASVEELKDAMSDPACLRKWNQDVNPVAGERLQNNGVKMLGGLPDSRADRTNWFVEHGFMPEHCSVLNHLCYRSIHDYCTQLENKMHIRLGRSTSAYMIADPLAVLEEGEVHFGFSSTFQDPDSGWSDVMLHDIDVLVARSPARLPSDVQKVRAVFKPELRCYKDVIVFSSKGPCSLADKLSGGDYDGDKAWVCWDPCIVDPFKNSLVVPAPSSEFYGLEADNLRVKDIIDQPAYLSRFLNHSFQFNLESNLLGICTNYHKNLCYTRNSMHDASTILVAQLLGKLVDRPKQGFSFDSTKWRCFLKARKLDSDLPKPAYENKGGAKATSHILDRLAFVVAAGTREKALQDFSSCFDQASLWDTDLIRLWNTQFTLPKDDTGLLAVRMQLKADLEQILLTWKANASEGTDETGMCKSTRKGSSMTFHALVDHCRYLFLAVQPLKGIDHPVVHRWRSESGDTADAGKSWLYIKASALFSLWYRYRDFPWWVAGKELGEIKAKARGLGSYHIVVDGLYELFKFDGKMLRRREGVEYGLEQWRDGEKEYDYGSDPEDFEGFE